MCFHHKTVKETKVSETKTSVPENKFKIGDQVRITRRAASHERGWENSWVREMDEAVGKIGTVVSPEKLNLLHNVGVELEGREFGYPSFVLELVPAGYEKFTHQYLESAPSEFKVGDRVQVNYKPNSMWNGIGFVSKIHGPVGGTNLNSVQVTVNKMVGAFKPEHLTLVNETTEPIHVERRTQGKEFNIGDTVRAIGRAQYDSPSTVDEIDKTYVYIRTSKGERGGFYPYNLTLIKPINSSSLHSVPRSTVYSIAKGIAVKLAKTHGVVNADNIQEELFRLGYSSTDLGNAAGSLFHGKNWEKVSTINSTRKGNRLRQINQWKYIGA